MKKIFFVCFVLVGCLGISSSVFGKEGEVFQYEFTLTEHAGPSLGMMVLATVYTVHLRFRNPGTDTAVLEAFSVQSKMRSNYPAIRGDHSYGLSQVLGFRRGKFSNQKLILVFGLELIPTTFVLDLKNNRVRWPRALENLFFAESVPMKVTDVTSSATPVSEAIPLGFSKDRNCAVALKSAPAPTPGSSTQSFIQN